MPKLGATNVENFDSLASTGMNWANKVRVIANGIGACVGNASGANSRFCPHFKWPDRLRESQDDVAIAFAGAAQGGSERLMVEDEPDSVLGLDAMRPSGVSSYVGDDRGDDTDCRTPSELWRRQPAQ
jgi:hypothetical protein